MSADGWFQSYDRLRAEEFEVLEVLAFKGVRIESRFSRGQFSRNVSGGEDFTKRFLGIANGALRLVHFDSDNVAKSASVSSFYFQAGGPLTRDLGSEVVQALEKTFRGKFIVTIRNDLWFAMDPEYPAYVPLFSGLSERPAQWRFDPQVTCWARCVASPN